MSDFVVTPSQSSNPVSTSRQQTQTVWPPKVNIFGLGVSVTDMDTAVAAIRDAAIASEPASVSCHSAHAIVEFTGSPERTSRLENFEMITPDGQPVRWAMNILHGAGLKDRVYGPELMLSACEMAAEQELPIFLYGATVETLQLLSRRLYELYPNLKIAGTISPPFRQLTKDETQSYVDQINSSAAKILFVGLGCPKQDLFVADNRHVLNPVQLCVGAAFDFHAGNKPIAPSWMQKIGCEWFFRLCCEPRRLFARYATTNTIFLFRFFKQFCGWSAKTTHHS